MGMEGGVGCGLAARVGFPHATFGVQNSEEAENSKFKPSVSGHHEDKFIRIEG